MTNLQRSHILTFVLISVIAIISFSLIYHIANPPIVVYPRVTGMSTGQRFRVMAAGTFTDTSTADFDAGNKTDNSDGNYQIETNTDNPTKAVDSLSLCDRYGYNFNKPHVDSDIWKFNYRTVTGAPTTDDIDTTANDELYFLGGGGDQTAFWFGTTDGTDYLFGGDFSITTKFKHQVGAAAGDSIIVGVYANSASNPGSNYVNHPKRRLAEPERFRPQYSINGVVTGHAISNSVDTDFTMRINRVGVSTTADIDLAGGETWTALGGAFNWQGADVNVRFNLRKGLAGDHFRSVEYYKITCDSVDSSIDMYRTTGNFTSQTHNISQAISISELRFNSTIPKATDNISKIELYGSDTNDTSAAALVDAFVNGTDFTITSGESQTLHTITDSNIANDAYQFWWYKFTLAGAGNSSPIIYDVAMDYDTNDATAPAIILLSPTNNSILTTSILNITGTASDTKPDSITTNSPYFATNSGNFTNWNFTNTSLADGTYTIIISANDSFGNTNSTSITFTINTSAPTITLSEPVDLTIGTSSTAVFTYTPNSAGTISDCSLIIDNNIEQTDASITKGTEQSFTQTGLFDAKTYIWSINCTDATGATTASSSRTLRISIPSEATTVRRTGGAPATTPTEAPTQKPTTSFRQPAPTRSEPAKEQLEGQAGEAVFGTVSRSEKSSPSSTQIAILTGIIAVFTLVCLQGIKPLLLNTK